MFEKFSESEQES